MSRCLYVKIGGGFMRKLNMQATNLVVLTMIICLTMFWVENSIQPNYIFKSIVKIVLFGGSILVYSLVYKENIIKNGIKGIANTKFNLMLAILIYLIIIIAFFICRGLLDIDQIRNSLLNKEGITKTNFVFVSVYISFINSFLEEIFFRGFIFLTLYKMKHINFAYFYSSISFALYHIGILSDWFNLFFFALIILALFAGGLVLDKLCAMSKSYLSPWMIHISANLGINTVGFIILGVL